MRTKGVVIVVLSLVFLLLLYAASHVAITKRRMTLGISYRLDVMPVTPALIKVFAGEFRGLMADYLLLEIGSYIGSNQELSEEEWERVLWAFRQALALDPHFQQTYIYVQGMVPWGAKKYKEAIALLDVSRAHRPWDWRPGWYIGFDYYYFFKDFLNASEAFLEAGKVKGAPALLSVLGARFAYRSGRAQAAIGLLKSMLTDPEIDKKKVTSIKERIKALEGVILLENAVKKYKAQYGAYPTRLEALTEKGLLSQLPENPYDDTFFYDEKDGQVFFDEVR